MFLLKVDTIESTWESLTLRTNKPRLVQHIAQRKGREGGRDEDGEDEEGNMEGEGEKKYVHTVVRAT